MVQNPRVDLSRKPRRIIVTQKFDFLFVTHLLAVETLIEICVFYKSQEAEINKSN